MKQYKKNMDKIKTSILRRDTYMYIKFNNKFNPSFKANIHLVKCPYKMHPYFI